MILEPFLPSDLYDRTEYDGWHADALYCLAKQLGVGNDFYYPLISAALMLMPPPKSGLWFWEARTAGL